MDGLIQKNKYILLTSLFILFCLGIYAYFPAKGNFQQIVTAVVFFIFLPILFNEFILRKNRSAYRLHIGDWKKGLFWTVVSIVIAVGLFAILVKYADFSHKYVLPVDIGKKFGYFLFYELVLVAFFTAMYEFFFRGFVMFQFVPFFKQWSIGIQFGLFLALLLVTGTAGWSFVPYMIFAPLAGWIAYKSDSLIYSFVGQLIFIIIVDVSIVKLLA